MEGGEHAKEEAITKTKPATKNQKKRKAPNRGSLRLGPYKGGLADRKLRIRRS